MNHNVYILGAGFSQEAGLPLIATFKDEMVEAKDWLTSKGMSREVRAIKSVLRFRQKAGGVCEYVDFEPNNIEQLFSLASAYSPELTDDVCIAIAATLYYCEQKKPKQHYRVNTHPSKNPKAPFHSVSGSVYSQFARLFAGKLTIRKTQNTVITLNYDTLLEEGFREADCSFVDGFVAKGNETPILKLHGSIGWSHTGTFANYDEVRANGIVPLLLPPTWNKHSDHRRVRHTWDSAIKALRTATRIIIIGFSFPTTDVHVKYLISAGLLGNIDLKRIMIVDKDPVAVRENLSRIFAPNAQKLFSEHPGGAWSFLFARDKLLEIERVDMGYSIEHASET